MFFSHSSIKNINEFMQLKILEHESYEAARLNQIPTDSISISFVWPRFSKASFFQKLFHFEAFLIRKIMNRSKHVCV